MKNRTFRASFPFVFTSLLVLALTVVVSETAVAQSACPPLTVSSSGPSSAPTNLRVDIPDASTGKLFVSWGPPTTGTFTYNVCRSTFPNSGYAPVIYCSQAAYPPAVTNPEYDIDSPGTGGILNCRDDGGVLANPNNAPLAVGTPYYYEVQACTGSGTSLACGPFTANPPFNTPVSVSCSTNPCFPTMQGSLNTKTNLITIASPPTYAVATTTILATVDTSPFAASHSEDYAYHNVSATPQNKLVVNLPGSGSYCGGGELMWVARNLGFDTICVNYDNVAEQENVCAATNFSGPPLDLSPTTTPTLSNAVANCFTNISQAKFNFIGDCILGASDLQVDCGLDSSKVAKGASPVPYVVDSQYDSVYYRITTMLQYLCTNENVAGKNGNPSAPNNTNWANYLTPGSSCTIGGPATPNWNSIILGGWSQGGDMATFADYYLASQQSVYVARVINLSAPPAAAAVGSTMVTPSYISPPPVGYGPPAKGIRNIYGLVSPNDLTHYCAEVGGVPLLLSVYQAVWDAIGFTSANDDAELDLNFNVNNYAFSAHYQYPNSPYASYNPQYFEYFPQPCTNVKDITNPPGTKSFKISVYGEPTSPYPSNPQSSLSSTGMPSHNIVSWAAVNSGVTSNAAGAGHADTLDMWNEDIYEYMLLEVN